MNACVAGGITVRNATLSQMLFAAVLLTIGGENAWAGCHCDCLLGSSVVFSHENPNINNAQDCRSACSFDSQVYGGPLTPAGQCITGGSPPPPLPIAVDFCAPIGTRPAVFDTGNDTGMLGKKTGTSCIPISDSITRYRTWCHTWVENDPSLQGVCEGSENVSSTCEKVGYVQRQFGSVTRIGGNQYKVCIHVENQDAGRTLHFIMEGAPY
jgi:hypothetical protein